MRKAYNDILLMAVRYALTRHSAAPHTVYTSIEGTLASIEPKTRKAIVQEIKEYLKANPDSGSVNNRIDNRCWRRITTLLEEGGIQDE